MTEKKSTLNKHRIFEKFKLKIQKQNKRNAFDQFKSKILKENDNKKNLSVFDKFKSKIQKQKVKKKITFDTLKNTIFQKKLEELMSNISVFDQFKLKILQQKTEISSMNQLKLILIEKELMKKEEKKMSEEEYALLKLIKLHKGLSKTILFSYETIHELKLDSKCKMRQDILSHLSSDKNKNAIVKSVGIEIKIDVNHSTNNPDDPNGISYAGKSVTSYVKDALSSLLTGGGNLIKNNMHCAIPFLTCAAVQLVDSQFGLNVGHETFQNVTYYGGYIIIALYTTISEGNYKKDKDFFCNNKLKFTSNFGVNLVGLLVEDKVSTLTGKRFGGGWKGSIVGVVSGALVNNMFKGSLTLVNNLVKKKKKIDYDIFVGTPSIFDDDKKNTNSESMIETLNKELQNEKIQKAKSSGSKFALGLGSALCSQLFMHVLYGSGSKTMAESAFGAASERFGNVVHALNLQGLTKNSTTIMGATFAALLDMGVKAKDLDKTALRIKKKYAYYISKLLGKSGLSVNENTIKQVTSSVTGGTLGYMTGKKLGSKIGGELGGKIGGGVGLVTGLASPQIIKFSDRVLQTIFRSECETLLSNLIYNSVDKATDLGVNVGRSMLTRKLGVKAAIGANMMIRNGFDFGNWIMNRGEKNVNKNSGRLKKDHIKNAVDESRDQHKTSVTNNNKKHLKSDYNKVFENKNNRKKTSQTNKSERKAKRPNRARKVIVLPSATTVKIPSNTKKPMNYADMLKQGNKKLNRQRQRQWNKEHSSTQRPLKDTLDSSKNFSEHRAQEERRQKREIRVRNRQVRDQTRNAKLNSQDMIDRDIKQKSWNIDNMSLQRPLKDSLDSSKNFPEHQAREERRQKRENRVRNRLQKDTSKNDHLKSQKLIDRDSRARARLDDRKNFSKLKNIMENYLSGKSKDSVQHAINESVKLGYFDKEMQKKWKDFDTDMKKKGIHPNERKLSTGYIMAREYAIASMGGSVLNKAGAIKNMVSGSATVGKIVGESAKIGTKVYQTARNIDQIGSAASVIGDVFGSKEKPGNFKSPLKDPLPDQRIEHRIRRGIKSTTKAARSIVDSVDDAVTRGYNSGVDILNEKTSLNMDSVEHVDVLETANLSKKVFHSLKEKYGSQFIQNMNPDEIVKSLNNELGIGNGWFEGGVMKALDKTEKRVGGTDHYRQAARVAFERGLDNKIGATARIVVGDGIPDAVNTIVDANIELNKKRAELERNLEKESPFLASIMKFMSSHDSGFFM